MEQGVTQGYLVPPTIFNKVVYKLARATLMEVCDPQESYHRLGWVAGEKYIIFYAENGRIAGRNTIWI